VGLAIRTAAPSKARFLGIVSAEFVTEELAVWGTPRLQFAIQGRPRLAAKCTACCYVSIARVRVHRKPQVTKVSARIIKTVLLESVRNMGGTPFPPCPLAAQSVIRDDLL
jgi:hypothetical protein